MGYLCHVITLLYRENIAFVYAHINSVLNSRDDIMQSIPKYPLHANATVMPENETTLEDLVWCRFLSPMSWTPRSPHRLYWVFL